MRKLKQWGAYASFLAMLIVSTSYAQEPSINCPADHPIENYTINGWTLYVRYIPCYYTTRRCVREQVPDKKRLCSRAITKFRMKEHVDYVPEYSTALLLSDEPNSSGNYAMDTMSLCPEKHPGIEAYEDLEYYEVMDYKIRYKWVNEQQCKIVPEYYWKQVNGTSCACQ